MEPATEAPAAFEQPSPQEIVLSGAWTARGIGPIADSLDAVKRPDGAQPVANGERISALDTAGAWVLNKFLLRVGTAVPLQGLRPGFARLLDSVAQHIRDRPAPAALSIAPGVLERIGRSAGAALGQGLSTASFIGEAALALAGTVARPSRLRWRPVLYNIRTAGFDALPIVGLLAFLLGVVVAYQGADQLRQYGANIFVADLVGLSMLREFAPLITAIIVAGRSGSAYAAQIGTMSVTDEIDAMRTIGIAPLDLLVLPKLLALLVAVPLLTAFADLLGVLGGMLMASAQLGVGYTEFLDRFAKAVSPTAFLIGICKAPVFAMIIAMVGCYQGFQTRGGADSVGRHTTRSVVQSIFLVIVADALFSVAFSALDL